MSRSCHEPVQCYKKVDCSCPCSREQDNNWAIWIIIAIVVIFLFGGFGDNR